MREIKFRAWDSKNHKMYHNVGFFEESWLSPDTEDGFIPCADSEIIPLEYTGLKDKNSVEIYEGGCGQGQ